MGDSGVIYVLGSVPTSQQNNHHTKPENMIRTVHLVPTFVNPELLRLFADHLLQHKDSVFADSAVVTIEGHSCPTVKEVDLVVIVALNGSFSAIFDQYQIPNMAVAYPSWAKLDTPSFGRIDREDVPIFRFPGGVLQSDGLAMMNFLDKNCRKLQAV